MCYSWVQAGVMGTHDEDTRKFFKHSSVICVLSPRYASSKLSIIKQRVRITDFEVVMDFEVSWGMIKIS